MQIDLHKKTVLVTGASRGIGRAIASRLVACGARVALHYHSSENAAMRLAADLGHRSTPFRADLCRPLEVIRLFIDVVKKFKKVDAVINNAGVAIASPVSDDDVEWVDDWSQTIMTNLNAAGLLCKKAIEHFVETGGGTIVNVSSRSAFRGETAEYLAYAASKGGLVSLTRSIARSFGKKGIKAFCLAPGFVKTDMAQSFVKMYGEKYVKDDIALDRLTLPEDVADMTAFLVSGFADHATGTVIDVNGGSYFH